MFLNQRFPKLDTDNFKLDRPLAHEILINDVVRSERIEQIPKIASVTINQLLTSKNYLVLYKSELTRRLIDYGNYKKTENRDCNAEKPFPYTWI